jgi:hypothetical protein
MLRHPRWLWLLRQLLAVAVAVFSIGLDLGSFEAPSQKPLTISSNNESFLNSLWRPFSQSKFTHGTKTALVKKSLSKRGRTGVTGIAAALAKSQPLTQLRNIGA